MLFYSLLYTIFALYFIRAIKIEAFKSNESFIIYDVETSMPPWWLQNITNSIYQLTKRVLSSQSAGRVLNEYSAIGRPYHIYEFLKICYAYDITRLTCTNFHYSSWQISPKYKWAAAAMCKQPTLIASKCKLYCTSLSGWFRLKVCNAQSLRTVQRWWGPWKGCFIWR